MHSDISDDPKNRRQELQQQVESYISKISQYEQLERQINEIDESINDNKSVSSNKRKDGHKKYNSQIQQKPVSNQRRNTNKKIKIYELQKKLKKLTGQFRQKANINEQNHRKEQQISYAIEMKSKRIEEEKANSKSLCDLEIKITRDIDTVSQKIDHQMTALQETVKNKQMFNFQKRKIRDHLRSIRLILSNATNHHRQQQVLDVSLDLSETYANNQAQQLESVYLDGLGKKCSEVGWADRQKLRIEKLFNKSAWLAEQTHEIMSQFYSCKKEFTNSQILAKHHRLTISLFSNQLKRYDALSSEIKLNLKERNSKQEEISDLIKDIEGERGFFRGKIGIVIQQQRLVRTLNVLMQSDLQMLNLKCQKLRMIKRLLEKEV